MSTRRRVLSVSRTALEAHNSSPRAMSARDRSSTSWPMRRRSRRVAAIAARLRRQSSREMGMSCSSA
jgi:hypothetical protein